jgi:soluble lytic murein transglycosylase
LPDNTDWDALQRRLALFVASRGHPDADRRLQELPARLVDESVEEWRVRVALQTRDWDGVLDRLQLMSTETAGRPQWRYWRARALESTGRRDDAVALYGDLSELRDYHGFLAADRLDRPYRIVHRPTVVPDARIRALAKEAGILRARELYRLQRLAEARVEWEQALAGADPDRLRSAARLADGWGWHDRAIVALGRTGDWDDLELRFPLPYRHALVDQARARGIDPAWVYAVARQESLFQTDARSGAGALGLMQILPDTGRNIAGELGVRWSGSYALLQPATNLRFGTHYLRRSLERLQNHPLLATAAYNAGPYRVLDWLPAGDPVPADIWAETIPFHETRGYVKRVMEYAVVYGWRLDNAPRRLSSRLRPVAPAG